MTIRTAKITSEGQVTIPADFREKYNLHEGDAVLFEDRDGHLTLRNSAESEDWTAGYLRQYTKGEYLTPEQIREVAAQAIAEQILEEMDEIGR